MKMNGIVAKGLWIVGLLLMLDITVAAYGVSRVGERADCPGKVECPLTGERVCQDKCPLGTDSEIVEAAAERPPCCRGKM